MYDCFFIVYPSNKNICKEPIEKNVHTVEIYGSTLIGKKTTNKNRTNNGSFEQVMTIKKRAGKNEIRSNHGVGRRVTNQRPIIALSPPVKRYTHEELEEMKDIAYGLKLKREVESDEDDADVLSCGEMEEGEHVNDEQCDCCERKCPLFMEFGKAFKYNVVLGYFVSVDPQNSHKRKRE